MSDFNYSIDDLEDTSSIVRKTTDSFYRNTPDGQPLRTSYSENGDPNRTLTQRDLQSVLSGDALYRSPNFALQTTNQTVQSSINRNFGYIRWGRFRKSTNTRSK